MLRVVSAAVHLEGDFILSAPPPARHCDLVTHIVKITGRPFTDLDAQGFLLSDGRFCRRTAAASVAIKAGQIKELNWPPRLYSEDLW